MSKYMDTKTGSLEESILGVWQEAAKKQRTETNKNDKSDDGEGLDKVQPKAVKKKFDDRKDKDIDNDGDTDSSDKFLHKKRKAISKAISKDEGNAFGKALMSAKEKGEKTFVVAGKKYNVTEEISNLEKINELGVLGTIGLGVGAYKLGKAVGKKSVNSSKKKNATEADDFRTHMMYDPKTGKSYEAKSMDDHNRMSKMGYTHKKPKMENYEVGTKERTDHTLNVTPGQSPEEFEQQIGTMQAKNNYMREALAKMWGMKEGHNPFVKDKKEEKKPKVEKTMTGKKATEVKVDPDLDEAENITAMKKQTKMKGKNLQAACGGGDSSVGAVP